ncbi:lipoprotein [Streptomyces griseoviridis]
MLHVALLAALLSGCGQAAEDAAGAKASVAASSPSSDAAPSSDATGSGRDAVARGATIGGPGSACELPVTFALAERWTAEPVGAGEKAGGADATGGTGDAVDPELLDAILRQGPVGAACEVDAKPAGHLGFLRVWTGEPGDDDPRTVLKAFVAAQENTSNARYRAFTSGPLTGVEVEYRYTSELLEETKPERALAVSTARGPVVLHLGGLDEAEFTAMTPAFDLAKRTLRAA